MTRVWGRPAIKTRSPAAQATQRSAGGAGRRWASASPERAGPALRHQPEQYRHCNRRTCQSLPHSPPAGRPATPDQSRRLPSSARRHHWPQHPHRSDGAEMAYRKYRAIRKARRPRSPRLFASHPVSPSACCGWTESQMRTAPRSRQRTWHRVSPTQFTPTQVIGRHGSLSRRLGLLATGVLAAKDHADRLRWL